MLDMIRVERKDGPKKSTSNQRMINKHPIIPEATKQFLV